MGWGRARGGDGGGGVKLLLPRCFNKCEDVFFLNFYFTLFIFSIELLLYIATISWAENNKIEKVTIKTLSLMIH